MPAAPAKQVSDFQSVCPPRAAWLQTKGTSAHPNKQLKLQVTSIGRLRGRAMTGCGHFARRANRLGLRPVLELLRKRSEERDLWNACRDQSSLMPADLVTLAHFSVSSAMSFPNSVGVIGIGTSAKPASRSFILGSARPAVISLLTLSITSAGVPFGAPTPNHAVIS